MLMSTKLHAFL